MLVGYTASNPLNVSGTRSKVFGILDILQSAANIGSTIDFGSLSIGRSGSVSDSVSANMLSSLSGSSVYFLPSSLHLNIMGNAVLNSRHISVSVGNALSLSAGGSVSNISPTNFRQGNASNHQWLKYQSRFRYLVISLIQD